MPSSTFPTLTTAAEIRAGIFKVFPLCIAVIPWGILAGSMAIHAGLPPVQAMLMSVVIFTGAAQLLSLSLLGVGASALTIVISVFFMTAQHYLYALALRPHVEQKQSKIRLLIGFLLTDELFAACAGRQRLSTPFMLAAGLMFYLAWNLSSLAGVILAASVPNLAAYHLDFSIVATFIAIVVPFVRSSPALVGVAVSMLLAVIFHALHWQSGTVIAGVLGMLAASLWESRT